MGKRIGLSDPLGKQFTPLQNNTVTEVQQTAQLKLFETWNTIVRIKLQYIKTSQVKKKKGLLNLKIPKALSDYFYMSHKPLLWNVTTQIIQCCTEAPPKQTEIPLASGKRGLRVSQKESKKKAARCIHFQNVDLKMKKAKINKQTNKIVKFTFLNNF